MAVQPWWATREEEGRVQMSPVYEVTAEWTERYYAGLRIEASSEEAARASARLVWRKRPEDFLGNAKFYTSRLVRFDVEPCGPEVRADVSA